MTDRYLKELANLHAVYETANQLDSVPLKAAIESAAARSAVMLGSGGSFSVASFAAYIHQLRTARLASPSTPLDYMTLPLRDATVMCFTASGRNKDICAAFDEAAQREAKPLIGLVMREHSPLHDLAERYKYSRIVSASSKLFEDGFLAVASLLGSAILILKAYRALVGDITPLPTTLDEFMQSRVSVSLNQLIKHTLSVVGAETTSVLYSSSLKPAAIDIESRFVEAALGNIHVTDLRNFGHGRHHWFAKRPDKTAILALIGDDQEVLANRTLELIPHDVPQARIDFVGPRDEQALAGLIVSLHLAAAAGQVRKIDPGKPGVPEFGRKLYHLAPARRRKARRTELTDIAVWRKEMVGGLKTSTQINELRVLCERGIERITQSCFAGVVFDYDGTLCEPDARFQPLSKGVATGLNKLLAHGAIIGIATGRGGSAAERIQEVIEKSYWKNVLIGFYNGAVVQSLMDGPPTPGRATPDVLCVEEKLRTAQHFSACSFRSNNFQIAISLPSLEEPSTSVRIATSIVEQSGVKAAITCSNHSVDIVFSGGGKTAVVEAIRKRVQVDDRAPVLRVGDKGRWPGNDCELLDDAFGLSVDEVSASTESCWGLSPRGVLGVQATLYYLDRIDWQHGSGSIHLE
ncbi:HAD hydrolase family protein [Pseudorhodoplanes sp.]|uniref:HAD hydrolase family protein n=1 Tax=Pseudorhodoplanes sp. TaxID=1934341 RepID=UPI003D0C1E0D